MDNEKYYSLDWQENKLKELYYAFGTSEKDGLKLFLNLVFELFYDNPSFLEKVYHTIDEVKQEAIYEITGDTLDWVKFWRSYDLSYTLKNAIQLEKLKELKNTKCLSKQNMGRLHFQLGILEVQVRNFSCAAENFEKSIRILPAWSWAYNNLGNIYRKLGRNEKAIQLFQKSIELDPKDATTYSNLGNVYVGLGRKEDAIAAYQKAIELDPTDATAYYNLAIVYSDLGRKDETIAAYQKVLELDPKDATTYNNLGNCYADLGRYAEAIAAYQQAIELDPKHVQAYSNLGTIYRNLEQHEEAMKAFQKAIELRSENAQARYNLAVALRGLGRNEKKIEAYRKAIVLGIKNPVFIILGRISRPIKAFIKSLGKRLKFIFSFR